MDRNNVVSQVVDAVKQVQEASGRTAVGIGSGTRPFTDVDGFDSLSGVEATVLLSQSLGRELPDSVFTSGEGSRILSVKEIAENVCRYMNSGSTNR